MKNRIIAGAIIASLALTATFAFANEKEAIPINHDINHILCKIDQEKTTKAGLKQKVNEKAFIQYDAPYDQLSYSGGSYSVGSDFFRDGVWHDGRYRYTYYSSNVLHHYRTDEWTAGADNIYRDSEGYVVVASSDHPQGTVISGTPFGDVKVYDTGCASGTLDVYTNY